MRKISLRKYLHNFVHIPSYSVSITMNGAVNLHLRQQNYLALANRGDTLLMGVVETHGRFALKYMSRECEFEQ